MDVSDSVERFITETKPLRAELAHWIESEEERLLRDLSDEEIEKKRDELLIKYNIKRL